MTPPGPNEVTEQRTQSTGLRGAMTRTSTIMSGPKRNRPIVPVHPSSNPDELSQANVNEYGGGTHHSSGRRVSRGYGQEAGPRAHKSGPAIHQGSIVHGGEWIHPMNPNLSSVVRWGYHMLIPSKAMICRVVPDPRIPGAVACASQTRWIPVVRPLPPAYRWIHAANGLPSTVRCYPPNPVLQPILWRVPTPLWHVTKRLPPAPVRIVVPGLPMGNPCFIPAQPGHFDGPLVQPIHSPPIHQTLPPVSEPPVSTCQSPREPSLPIYSIPPPSHISYYINNPPPPPYLAPPMNPITATPYRSSPSISPPPAYSSATSGSDVPPYSSSASEPVAIPPPPPYSSSVAASQSPSSSSNPAAAAQSPASSSNPAATVQTLNPESESQSSSCLNPHAKPYSPSPSISNDEPMSKCYLNPDAAPYPPSPPIKDLITPPLGPWLPEPGTSPALEPIVDGVMPFSDDPIFSSVWRPLPSTSFTKISTRKFLDWPMESSADDSTTQR